MDANNPFEKTIGPMEVLKFVTALFHMTPSVDVKIDPWLSPITYWLSPNATPVIVLCVVMDTHVDKFWDDNMDVDPITRYPLLEYIILLRLSDDPVFTENQDLPSLDVCNTPASPIAINWVPSKIT
jgi:hypothetical protein